MPIAWPQSRANDPPNMGVGRMRSPGHVAWRGVACSPSQNKAHASQSTAFCCPHSVHSSIIFHSVCGAWGEVLPKSIPCILLSSADPHTLAWALWALWAVWAGPERAWPLGARTRPQPTTHSPQPAACSLRAFTAPPLGALAPSSAARL